MQKKVQHKRRGKLPSLEVVDLFCGIGGLSHGMKSKGFKILAGFDINPTTQKTDAGKPIYSINRLESFCQCYDVAIGIITVPAEHAQEACDKVVACEIKAIWNFSTTHLNVPDDVVIQSENLAVSLTALRMQLKHQKCWDAVQ